MYSRHVYPNGLRLITVPMDSTHTVTVLVLVATGSRYETRENNGISHFLEHMMFKGTTKRPNAMDIAEELDAIGAEYNAFTSKEYTGYYVKCAAEKFNVALDVIADIFQNSKFNEHEIDKERGPIKEEINMYLDNPSRYVASLFEELMHGDQPLGWDTAGKKETIDRLARNDFVADFQTHYFAKNTVVALAGNINPSVVEAKVTEYFGSIRENVQIEALPAVVTQTKPQLKIFHKKTDQTHINLGFRAFSYLNPDYPVLEVMSVIMGGGMSSRLFTEVREKRGLAYRIHTGVSAYNETGDFTTSAGLNNANIIPALNVILDEYKKLTKEPISAKELAKAKDYIKGTVAIGLEASDDQASFYADQDLLEKRILTIEERLARIDAVNSEDILRVAQEIIKPSGLNLALIGPFDPDHKEIRDVLESF